MGWPPARSSAGVEQPVARASSQSRPRTARGRALIEPAQSRQGLSHTYPIQSCTKSASAAEGFMEQGMAVQAGCWEDLPPTSTTARKLLAGKVIRIFETLAAAANYLSSPNTVAILYSI